MSSETNIATINKSLNIEKYEVDNIKGLIYLVRGKQVIIDKDVAMLYEVETKQINQAVKRNIERFPEQFCFQLNGDEYNSLRSQIVTLKNYGRGQHRKYIPYVFTEQGIAMLSGILHSKKAIEVSINIIQAFVEMRKFILNNQIIFEKISNIELKQIEFQNTTNERFNQIFKYIEHHKGENQKIFFDGQIYDAYSLIINIIKSANNKILIIDNYIDDSVLEMLSKKKKNVEVVILTSSNSNISKLDVQKFNKEYPALNISKTNKFHDRFIVIDDNELYHCGASLKDLGKKCFAISKIEDIGYISRLNEKIKS